VSVAGLENWLLTGQARFRLQPKGAYPDLQSGVGFGLFGLTKRVVEDSLPMVGLLGLTQVYHNFGWVSMATSKRAFGLLWEYGRGGVPLNHHVDVVSDSRKFPMAFNTSGKSVSGSPQSVEEAISPFDVCWW